MENARERLLLALTEADMKASEAGIGVSMMSRVRLEYIVDRLLEAGVLLPPVTIGQTVYAYEVQGLGIEDGVKEFELKPCPNCGKEPVIVKEEFPHRYVVSCFKYKNFSSAERKEKAIWEWNEFFAQNGGERERSNR